MRRLGFTLAPVIQAAVILAVVILAVVPVTVGAVTPTATPTPPQARLVAAVPAAPGDTATVCQSTANTVSTGLQNFIGDMHKVRSQAGSGDLSGAQQSVQQSGAGLSQVAGQLREDSQSAQDAQLKSAVTALAGEFDRLGHSLTDLASLQHFDTAKLTTLADRVGDLCGATPGGSPTPSTPAAPGLPPAPILTA